MKKPTKEMLERFKTNIRAWTWNNKKEKDMVRLCKRDRADMYKIMTLLRNKKYAEAGKAMYYLDSIVRDAIPLNLYDLMVDYYENT